MISGGIIRVHTHAADFQSRFLHGRVGCIQSRSLGELARTSSGTVNNFEFCAVTDSQKPLFQRGLCASSARFYVDNFEVVLPNIFEPEYMADLVILRGIAEIEVCFG